MKSNKKISIFEHQRLRLGEHGFTQTHLDALLKLNDYHQGQYFEPIAKGIKFNQYVGVIQINGLTIEINPKADKDDPDDRWKGVLLKMLKACGRIKASSTGPAHVKRQHLNLLEVYFELYLLEVEGLIRRGLINRYRIHRGNLNALKGKLEFAQHIHHNLIHKERFYTSHQVYDKLHLVHQIMNEALEIVDQFTSGTRLYDLCKRVRLNYPLVDSKNITEQHFNTIRLDRKTASYSYVLELARLIILHYSPDITSGKERMLSLLFDMNQLWEEYILKQLKKAAVGTDFIVSGQETKGFWGSNSLRPDIVIRRGSKTYIIDTKWKRPSSNAASVGDLRQMYAYCRYWDAEKALLLYPGNKANNTFNKYKTDDYAELEGSVDEIHHYCKMGFVSVINEETDQLDETIGTRVLELLEIT